MSALSVSGPRSSCCTMGTEPLGPLPLPARVVEGMQMGIPQPKAGLSRFLDLQAHKSRAHGQTPSRWPCGGLQVRLTYGVFGQIIKNLFSLGRKVLKDSPLSRPIRNGTCPQADTAPCVISTCAPCWGPLCNAQPVLSDPAPGWERAGTL